ncbi:hypothetical protein [Luteolibacter luteus]|uniref:Uncharacterized protein n=1 Tax=Luteolibacter luteus TaxID=2728835 RepID=A0A858RJL0_9BACT|nr:hypothetical protein [Luteolibacter luteus]QJE96390.1 hypothetical protein HHL09_11545 [Luteolibacter luteus]
MGDAPRNYGKPSEDALHRMLEERERSQANNQRHLKRIASRILLGIFAVVLLGFLSMKEARDLIVSLFQDKPQPSKVPLQAEPGVPGNMNEETVKKVADMVSKASGGQVIDKGDIEFGAELLNFMQTPKPAKDGPHAAKTTPHDK